MAKIPATVITGFLGSGKTTLVRDLLASANGMRIALIINEFGDVGVDGEILKNCGIENCADEDVIELANGCICCTVADEFIPMMEKLLARKDPPDHIVIETSGLALPQPLVRAFNWPAIKSRVTVDGVVTLVDGPAFAEGRFADDMDALEAQRLADAGIDHEVPIQELFNDQLNCADIVILNKIDLMDAASLASVSHDIAQALRPGAQLIASQQGKITADVLLGLDSNAEDDLATRQSTHEMEGVEQHDHDDFVSFVLPLPTTTDRDGLIARIKAAITAHDILRVKGFADVQGASARLVIQAAGPRIDSYFDRPWSANEARNGALVVIGQKGMDAQAITAHIKG
jgi:cobalamin biosynthesis protein CobW